MPYFRYVCTNCSEPWKWDVPTYLGGALFLCTVCNVTQRIPHYCPTCNPPSLDAVIKFENPRESGNLSGGKLVTCSIGHPYHIPVSEAEAYEKLGQIGDQIGQNYNQTSQVLKLAEDLRKKVSGGMCKGVAMDWIRRALLSYQDTGKMSPNRAAFGTPTGNRQAEKEAIRDRRHATAFLNLSMDVVNRFQDEHCAGENAKRKRDKEAEEDQALVDVKKMSSGQLGGKDPQQFYDGRIQEIRKKYADLAKAPDKPIMENYWEEYARKMDTHLADDRRTQGKHGSSERGFSRLTLVTASDFKVVNGVNLFVTQLLNNGAFATNHAALVNFAPMDDSAGHAIAILRLNSGDYLLFDPNYGTFKLSQENTRKAVVYLFLIVYPHSDGGDSKVYQDTNGNVKASYEIFKGNAKSVQATSQTLVVKTELPESPIVMQPVPVPTKPALSGNNQARLASPGQFSTGNTRGMSSAMAQRMAMFNK